MQIYSVTQHVWRNIIRMAVPSHLHWVDSRAARGWTMIWRKISDGVRTSLDTRYRGKMHMILGNTRVHLNNIVRYGIFNESKTDSKI